MHCNPTFLSVSPFTDHASYQELFANLINPSFIDDSRQKTCQTFKLQQFKEKYRLMLSSMAATSLKRGRRHVVSFMSDERFQQLNGPESFLLYFLFNSITSIPSEMQVFKPSTDTKLDVFSLEDVESTLCKNNFDLFDLFSLIRTVFHFDSVHCKRSWTQIRWRCFWIMLVSSLHDRALS